MMSTLQDQRTVTVTYDWMRGEPRGRLALAAAHASRGDCIDCGQCVTVCPTGIDIRNGIQLECINCTACMDACDAVMTRLQRSRGLIRLTSHQAVATGRTRWLTSRVLAYSAVWLVLAATVTVLLATRRDVDVLILRQPGTLFANVDRDNLANFYNVQVINRTNRPQQLEYAVVSPRDARVTPLGSAGEAAPYGLVESRLLLTVPERSLSGASTPVTFEVRSNGRVVQRIESSFLGPANSAAEREGGGSQ
jgi:cytochrome c oxidase accessory protein FixG